MRTFSSILIAWQKQHGRHDLPWQNTHNPYRIWLSEIMLQQTQVATVIPYYQRFLARFPSIEALAEAPVEAVMAHWSGLGYYARARNLHRAAQQIMQDHDGVFPKELDDIERLPGIGRSTVAAVAVFSFGTRAAILDGNVKRVLTRHFGVTGFPGAKKIEEQLWQLAHSLLPNQAIEQHIEHNTEAQDIARYTQGLMDLGATLCTRAKPRCLLCPMAASCVAFKEQRVAELPTARPKRVQVYKTVTMLILYDGKSILLERRPPTGIWGGLSSLPELSTHESDPATLSNYAYNIIGAHIESVEQLAPLKHAFTHFQLTIQPLLCRVTRPHRVAQPDNREWINLKKLDQLALPAPVKKILYNFLPCSAR